MAGIVSSSSFTIVAGKKGSFRSLGAVGSVGSALYLGRFFPPESEDRKLFPRIHTTSVLL